MWYVPLKVVGELNEITGYTQIVHLFYHILSESSRGELINESQFVSQ